MPDSGNHMPCMVTRRMADDHEQQRRASGYFLIGLGVPIAAAFIYPFIAGRRGRTLIEWEALSAQQLTVFLVGAAIGIAMSIAGVVILQRR